MLAKKVEQVEEWEEKSWLDNDTIDIVVGILAFCSILYVLILFNKFLSLS